VATHTQTWCSIKRKQNRGKDWSSRRRRIGGRASHLVLEIEEGERPVAIEEEGALRAEAEELPGLLKQLIKHSSLLFTITLTISTTAFFSSVASRRTAGSIVMITIRRRNGGEDAADGLLEGLLDQGAGGEVEADAHVMVRAVDVEEKERIRGRPV